MTAIELIAAERQRQIEKECYTAEHDAQHKNDELALAAACYALPGKYRCYRDIENKDIPEAWPWNWGAESWKETPDDRIRELVKAGALIVAEIDRLTIGAGGVNNDKNR